MKLLYWLEVELYRESKDLPAKKQASILLIHYYCSSYASRAIDITQLLSLSNSLVWINRAWLPILLVVSRTGKLCFPLVSFAPENLVHPFRPVSARSSLTPRPNLVLTHGLRSFLPLSATINTTKD